MKEVKPYTNSYVTFGDGTKGKIVGKGKLVYPGIPNLEYILLVGGLTTNIISISKLYDQDSQSGNHPT